MTPKTAQTIDKLNSTHSLSLSEYEHLLKYRDDEARQYLRELAVKARKDIYGDAVYMRGLIEMSSYCKNDCYYCGIRRSNADCERYRLSREDIRLCVDEGYKLGFRTFVLQGGEDAYYTDELLCDIISDIKVMHPDCAVTLSIGERSYESFKRLKAAGADRYLLRHETADREHYEKLHPKSMSYDYRMKCLEVLRDLGYQTGCGFMVGSPYQTYKELAEDLKYVEDFKPDMCGIGPFIPHHGTPFKDRSGGTAELTCYLLSILRLIYPPMLIPATTALGTISEHGREEGILSGANVVMPNLSPIGVRKKYELYDNKICTGEESAQCVNCLKLRIGSIGYEIVVDRGDIRKSYGEGGTHGSL